MAERGRGWARTLVLGGYAAERSNDAVSPLLAPSAPGRWATAAPIGAASEQMIDASGAAAGRAATAPAGSGTGPAHGGVDALPLAGSVPSAPSVGTGLGDAAGVGAGGPVAAGSAARTGRAGRRRGGVLFWMAAGWLLAIAVVAVAAPWLPFADPEDQDLANRLARPFESGENILGTDGLGRDILARLAFGARVSLVISLAAVSIGMAVGGSLGMAAGYVRGRFDGVVMWAMNVILAFPGLVLLLGLVAFAGQSLSAITLVVGFLSVPIYARVARATTLTVSQREYVQAARALGATRGRILLREILPNVVLPVFAFGLVALGVVIVLEGSLAFLGLSVRAPDPTWGSMIAEGRRHLNQTTHLSLVPSVAMFLTVLAVNFVGDTLRSRFDVRESAL
jgi:peptide/nickel transport system permease protein